MNFDHFFNKILSKFSEFYKNFRNFAKFDKIWQNLPKLAFSGKIGEKSDFTAKTKVFFYKFWSKNFRREKKMSKICKICTFLHFFAFSGNFSPDFQKTRLQFGCFFPKNRCFFDKNFWKIGVFFGNHRSPLVVPEFTWRENLNFCKLLFLCRFFWNFRSFYSPNSGKVSVGKIFWHILFLPL